jgi:hypothetical protein
VGVKNERSKEVRGREDFGIITACASISETFILSPMGQLPHLRLHITYQKALTLQAHNKLISGLLVSFVVILLLTQTLCTCMQSSIGFMARIFRGILIVNPGDFGPELKGWVDSLGPVRFLVSTTAGHGAGLARSFRLWPQAALLGTDPVGLHQQPTLPWTAFLQDDQEQSPPIAPSSSVSTAPSSSSSASSLSGAGDGHSSKTVSYRELFGEEIQVYQLKGHLFRETVLYHVDTKALVGLTDMMMNTDTDRNRGGWAVQMYMFGLGCWRPQNNKLVVSQGEEKCQHRKLLVQSYMYLNTLSYPKLRASLEKVLQLDFDYVTLGHGGILKGPEAKEELRQAFDWVLDKEKEPSLVEKFYLPTAWLIRMRIVPALIQVIWQETKRKFAKDA